MAMTPDDLLAQVATDLDALMHARSLTQQALYQAAGVGEGTVSRVLRARDCRLSTLARLSQALGVRVQIVFHMERNHKI